PVQVMATPMVPAVQSTSPGAAQKANVAAAAPVEHTAPLSPPVAAPAWSAPAQTPHVLDERTIAGDAPIELSEALFGDEPTVTGIERPAQIGAQFIELPHTLFAH